jgi:hypothetical protein
MPITCNSPMRADPSTIPIPGACTLSFDAMAHPATTDADVVYSILPGSVGICFGNGTKHDRRRQRVSAAGTTVVHDARFLPCAGVPPAAFEVRAEVSESGVVQCARTATIGVRIVAGSPSFEMMDVSAPAAAPRSRKAPRKAPRKTPRKTSRKASRRKAAEKPARKRARRATGSARKKPKRPTRRATRRKRSRRL